MLDYMPKEIFALRIDLVEDARTPALPRVYARSFELGTFAMGNMAPDARFVAVGSRQRPDLKMVSGAVEALRSGCDLPVVVVSPSLDWWQKEWLVSRQMPFIQDGRNAFLPFSGLAVRDASRTRRPSSLSPQAQRIVVNLIEGNWDLVSAGEVAKRVGRSRASVSKYLAEIEAVCPGAVRREGRSAVLCVNRMKKEDLLDCFEPYLGSPVSRRFRISRVVGLVELARAGARLSGLSALAGMSDLAGGDAYPTVAIPRDALPGALAVLGESVEELPWWDEEGVEVEAWEYWDDKPATLRGSAAAGPDTVSRLSLYLSLRDRFEDDVRVSDAIDQLREKICQS